ncbi:hypothetical protein PYCC9005_002797 [Savitreella phatthalungensis]
MSQAPTRRRSPNNNHTAEKPPKSNETRHLTNASPLGGIFTLTDLVIVGVYPLTLLLGIAFELGHPDSYFAHATNLFNVVFVKNGWFWTTAVFGLHVYRLRPGLRMNAVARWAIATVAWIFVTQWAFGAPLTDRTMVWTGGVCELAADAAAGKQDPIDADTKAQAAAIITSAACKKIHGKLRGGHDLSGHVFLLTHASLFLIYEMLPVLTTGSDLVHDISTRLIGVVVIGWWWMLLMTAAYFHTRKEKFTGLITGLISWVCVYKIAPLFPATKQVVGIPTV